jgi:thioredoxin-like negative regulator of GroEL
MGWLGDLFKVKAKVQPVSVNDENFEAEVVRSELPVMLDVWTPTCTHCHKLEPIVMDLATRYQGRVKVAEVNGAEAPATMARLQVRGTPTVIYFREGREVERVVGFRGSLYHSEYIDNELLQPGGESQGPPAETESA